MAQPDRHEIRLTPPTDSAALVSDFSLTAEADPRIHSPGNRLEGRSKFHVSRHRAAPSQPPEQAHADRDS